MSVPTTVPQLIDSMWVTYSATLSSGATNEIVVPVALKDIIGQQGIDTIATRFRNIMHTGSVIIADTTRGTFTIKPAPIPQGDHAIAAGDPKASKLPRPPNAFILYRQQNHPIVMSQNPGFHNTQISIILGIQWKNESEAIKDHFKNMAEAIKKKHHRDHPNYLYQPRKPADKKRRMTRRKIATLATMSTNQPQEKVAPVLPEFTKTSSGNVILNIGDQDLEEETFCQMLKKYNKDITPLPHQTGNNSSIGLSALEASGFTQQVPDNASLYANTDSYEGKSVEELGAAIGDILDEKFCFGDWLQSPTGSDFEFTPACEA